MCSDIAVPVRFDDLAEGELLLLIFGVKGPKGFWWVLDEFVPSIGLSLCLFGGIVHGDLERKGKLLILVMKVVRY